MKNWEDKHLEDLLRKMPQLTSHRDPEEVYRQIRKKANIAERKQKRWLIPSLATLAALAIFLILGISQMNFQSSESTQYKLTNLETEQKAENSTKKDQAMTDKLREANPEQSLNMDGANHSVSMQSLIINNQELNNQDVYSLMLTDDQALFQIPISVVAEKSADHLDVLKNIMANLDEQQLGLTDYYPLNATLTIKEETKELAIDVPADQTYQYGSASEELFKQAVNQLLLTLHLDRAVFTTNGTLNGIELGNSGVLESLEVKEELRKAFFLYHPPTKSESTFLVASNTEYETIEDAIEAMRKTGEHELAPSIPQSLIIDEMNDRDNGKLEVVVDTESKLEVTPELLTAFEAILVVAKSFQYQSVQFIYPSQNAVGNIPFNEDIQVPIAWNKVELP